MAAARRLSSGAMLRAICAVPVLFPALAGAMRELSKTQTIPQGRSVIDYTKELDDIKSCAASGALTEWVLLMPGKGGQEMRVSRDMACFMKIVQSMTEDHDDDDDNTAGGSGTEIPLPNVDSEALGLLVEFATSKMTHAGSDLDNVKFSRVPRPLSGPLREQDTVLQEDAAFMDDVAGDLNRLFKLTNAANFVDCPALLELCAARIAEMFIGKTPQQIREVIPNALAEGQPQQQPQA